ncbi:MAG: hypothetical protein V7L25_04165 [Nostoc sp.]
MYKIRRKTALEGLGGSVALIIFVQNMMKLGLITSNGFWVIRQSFQS